MERMIPPGRLDRPVDRETDHVLGPADAEVTLVEYGSYACPHCRAANERIAQARDQLGDRVCYAFRHRPLADNSLSFRAAELAELAQTPEAFWSAPRHPTDQLDVRGPMSSSRERCSSRGLRGARRARQRADALDGGGI